MEILTETTNFQHFLLAREVLFILSIYLKIKLPDQTIGLLVITKGRDQMYKSYHKERYIASNSSHKPKPNWPWDQPMRLISPTICDGLSVKHNDPREYIGSISLTINKVSMSMTQGRNPYLNIIIPGYLRQVH